jgi:malonate transporter MadL subunit
MIIYGVALLALSFLLGQWMGEALGSLLGIDANVGGVGFAMLILMLLKDWFLREGWMKKDMDAGIDFWGKMYIPVVIAMAASLNVKGAVSSGLLAVLAGAIPVAICFAVFPIMLRRFKTD